VLPALALRSLLRSFSLLPWSSSGSLGGNGSSRSLTACRYRASSGHCCKLDIYMLHLPKAFEGDPHPGLSPCPSSLWYLLSTFTTTRGHHVEVLHDADSQDGNRHDLT